MDNFRKIDAKWDRICQVSWYYVDDVVRTRETSVILNPTF